MNNRTNIYKLLLVAFGFALSLWSCKEQGYSDDDFLQVQDEDVQISLNTDSLIADSISTTLLMIDIDPSVHLVLEDSFTLKLEPIGFFHNGQNQLKWPLEHSGHHKIQIYGKQMGSSQLTIDIGNGFNYTKWLHFKPSFPDAMLLQTNAYKFPSQINQAVNFTLTFNKNNGGIISEDIPINVYLLDSLNTVQDEIWLKTNLNNSLSGAFTLIDSVYKGKMQIKATVKNGQQELIERFKTIELE